MSISRTILVILDIFVLVWIRVLNYLLDIVITGYLKELIHLDKIIYGNFSAGRVFIHILVQTCYVLGTSIRIYKHEYIQDVRYV